jgi:hypothetical protein
MEYVKKEYQAAKEVDEVMSGLASLVESIKLAKADGWSWGQDLPAVLMANFGKLSAAVEGLDKITGEWEADQGAVLKAVLNPSVDLALALAKKPAPPVA